MDNTGDFYSLDSSSILLRRTRILRAKIREPINIGMDVFFKKIIKEPIVQFPWPHQTVPEAMDQSLFDKIKQDCEYLQNLRISNILQIYPPFFEKYNLTFAKELKILSQELLVDFKKIIEHYPYHRAVVSPWVETQITVIPHNNTYPIHDERYDKILSMVVYVAPVENQGTMLYSSNDENTLEATVPWKENTSFVFCGQQGKTWHSYGNQSCDNRVSLNFFVRNR